jgi:hypothetical protein
MRCKWHASSLVLLHLLWLTGGGLPGLAQVQPLTGTLVSGVAVFRPDGANSQSGVPARGVEIFCAWGQYKGEVYTCPQIWGKDCSAGLTDSNQPAGLFHFYHPDAPKMGISLLHRLEEVMPCSDPAMANGRYFSMFIIPQIRDQGQEVKTTFVLHPTNVGFKDEESAAQQIRRTVAVHYFIFRRLEAEKEGVTEATTRDRIAREVAIILDSKEDDPSVTLAKLRERLSRVTIHDGGETVRVIDWLPAGETFLKGVRGSFEKEKEAWLKVAR